MSTTPARFLDMVTGPYSMALRATSVLHVMQDVPHRPHVRWRDMELPFADLSYLFLRQERRTVPFAIAFEASGGKAAFGVDALGRGGHIGQEDPGMVSLPAFGLLQPELFEGVLRQRDRLLLVLRAESLLNLVLLSPPFV